MAKSVGNLAVLHRAQGRYAEAEPLYKRALAIAEQALGPAHPNVATSLNNLVGLYDAQGKYTDAEPLYQRSLAIREKALGPEHPEVAASLNTTVEKELGGDVTALKEIGDRLDGKPAQAVELGGKDGEDLSFTITFVRPDGG